MKNILSTFALIGSAILVGVALASIPTVVAVFTHDNEPQTIEITAGEEPVLSPGIAIGEKFHYLEIDGELFHLKSPVMGELIITEIEGKWVHVERTNESRKIEAEYWVNWDNVSFYTTEKMKYNKHSFESDVNKSPHKVKKED